MFKGLLESTIVELSSFVSLCHTDGMVERGKAYLLLVCPCQSIIILQDESILKDNYVNVPRP